MVRTNRALIVFLTILAGLTTSILAQSLDRSQLMLFSLNDTPDKQESKIPDKFFAPDKAQHLMGSLISTVFFYKVFEGPVGTNSRESRYLAGGITLSLGISKEIWDSTDPQNRFSWKDIIANLTGITLGLVIVNQP